MLTENYIITDTFSLWSQSQTRKISLPNTFNMPFFKKSQLNEKFIDKTSSETLEMLNFPDCHENVMKVRFVFDSNGYR